jgi:hypothetical protein
MALGTTIIPEMVEVGTGGAGPGCEPDYQEQDCARCAQEPVRSRHLILPATDDDAAFLVERWPHRGEIVVGNANARFQATAPVDQ